ncbi:Fic family protein [Oligella urethralis]|uniref:Fic family protein n=1 Tax=Oligella urethralis TaxID=90245 RepID=UPI000C9ADA1C|nr:Fic family protein [Oligella urethralis]PMC18232.1 Fic family protein [Oligella urethralis]
MTTLPKLSELTSSERRELFAYLRTAITHHSNAMEGVSLTYGETKRLLEEGFTAPNKPLSDHLIILGFANAFDEVVLESYARQPLTTSFIKDLHATLFKTALAACPDKIDKPVGAYRTDERYIVGLSAPLASPRQISNQLENLLYVNQPKSMQDIAKFHIDFELIHPFADGNGRVGRLLITYQSIQNDLIPPLIENEHRKDYLNAISDPAALTDFLYEAQKQSYHFVEERHQQNKQDREPDIELDL